MRSRHGLADQDVADASVMSDSSRATRFAGSTRHPLIPLSRSFTDAGMCGTQALRGAVHQGRRVADAASGSSSSAGSRSAPLSSGCSALSTWVPHGARVEDLGGEGVDGVDDCFEAQRVEQAEGVLPARADVAPRIGRSAQRDIRSAMSVPARSSASDWLATVRSRFWSAARASSVSQILRRDFITACTAGMR